MDNSILICFQCDILRRSTITKVCSKCAVEKDVDQYYKNKKHKDGLSGYCKSCHNQQTYLYRKNNPQRTSKTIRRAALKARYGITESAYNKLYVNQQGKCAICKCECATGRALAVDHCHKTLVVRGLLCSECNTGLGKFKDNTGLLTEAINYLEKYEI